MLGISEQLTRRYTSLLDTIEEFIDQDQVQDINVRIDRAKGELNLSALKQLHALKKNFKVGSMLHDYKDISANLSKLIQEVRVYYESLFTLWMSTDSMSLLVRDALSLSAI